MALAARWSLILYGCMLAVLLATEAADTTPARTAFVCRRTCTPSTCRPSATARNTYHIEEILTAAVVRELRSRTNYRIVTTNDGTADATLHGTVLNTFIAPLTYNSQTGGISSSWYLSR